MKVSVARTLILMAVVAGMPAGCDSVRESMRERFTPMQPKVRIVQGDSKQVFTAARAAMGRLGFEMVRGGPAQGELEGLTPIGGGNDLQSSRQRDMTVHLTALGDGRVEVRVLIQEIEEDRYSRLSNPATSTPVRDPTVYDTFFDELERQLQGVANK